MMKAMLAFLAGAALASPLAGQTPLESLQGQSDTPMLFAFGGTNRGTQSFLGVAVAELDANRARELNIRDVHGVEITRVDEESAAAKAGLKVGDVILEYNGQRVEGTEQFVRLVRETPAGRQVNLIVSRAGADVSVPLVMGSRRIVPPMIGPPPNTSWFSIPAMPSTDFPQVFGVWGAGTIGVDAEALSPQLAEFFGVKKGVLIRSVTKGSNAERAGIRAGDVFVKVDQTEVAGPEDVRNAIQAAKSRRKVTVELIRDKNPKTIVVEVDADRGNRLQPMPQSRSIKL